MERAEWLKKVRAQAEKLYDHGAPAYWTVWGLSMEETHRQFIEKFLGKLGAKSYILDAACGAGLYDGMLHEAGHTMLGIDQSAGVLAGAREHYPQADFPRLQYTRLGLQEMDFHDVFDVVIYMDAMEHIWPEDWLVILERFQKAPKPDGILYMTVDIEKPVEDREAFERAKVMGLPVVYGEIVYELDDAYDQAMALDPMDLNSLDRERLDHTVYHFHPSLEQAQVWIDQAGLAIEERASTDWYEHYLLRKIN